jgi:hypothetical protein
MDAETRALSKRPVFQSLIAAGRTSKAKGGISADELARRHDITDEERAAVRARIIRQARAEREVTAPPSANGQATEEHAGGKVVGR